MFDPSIFDNNLFPFLLLLIIAVIIFKILKAVIEWRRNEQQPVLTVQSEVASKRMKTSRAIHKPHHKVTADYYASFKIEENKTLEFLLTKKEFEQLNEGDVGKLTFQGTMFQRFEKLNGN